MKFNATAVCLASQNILLYSSLTKKRERKPLLTSVTTLLCVTVFATPFAHVTSDETIQVDASNVVETSATTASLFNGTMPDRTCQTHSISFDDDDIKSVVSSTIITDGLNQFERLFAIHNVSAIKFSPNIHMSSFKSTKVSSSNAVPKARPFDEFVTEIIIMPACPLDGQSYNMTTKSNKD